ncbi:cupredoxin domain-containing protein [Rhodococcus sp. NPDC058505]|uniref:cupredoxin domain-containing protein n=1 Tax=unclassified Rhodococcus (in: high G+C Gram-positive bacteria) TaxID=192944 RepID=UPI00366121D9
MTRTRTVIGAVAAAAMAAALSAGCDSADGPTTPEAPVVTPGHEMHDGDDDIPPGDLDDDGPASTTGTVPADQTVSIESHAFVPPVLTVRPGGEVTVGNRDDVEHSVTSDTAGYFDEDVDGRSNADFTAPSTPGSYPFHCTYHPEMRGTLIVQ